MEHGKTLRQLLLAERVVEQFERALVARMVLGVPVERTEPRNQFRASRLERRITLAKIGAWRW